MPKRHPYFDIRLIASLPWSIGSLVISIFRRSDAKRWIRARRSLALPWRDWLVGRESPRAQTSRSPSDCPNDVPTYFDIRLMAWSPWSIGSLVISIFRRSDAKREIRARRSLAYRWRDWLVGRESLEPKHLVRRPTA